MLLLLQWQFACWVAITILGKYGIILQLYALLIKFMDSLQLLGVGGYRLLLMNMCCIVEICGA